VGCNRVVYVIHFYGINSNTILFGNRARLDLIQDEKKLSSQVSLVPISFPLDIASIIDGLIYGGAILVFSDASGVMDRFGISDYW
jgi:hypothetical protein